jgi:uncharacterized C2H2 Zn-finger protein
MKCFCGKEATHQVTVKSSNSGNKFLNCPRCEDCKDRAERSYDDVESKEIKK